jgi:hypothetical protein
MVEGYIDDPSICDGDILLRRIPPTWWEFDENMGVVRPTSQGFRDHRSGTPMSVHLLAVLQQHGVPAAALLDGHRGFALVAITAGLARRVGQGIRRVPLDGDPAHAEVFGDKTSAVRRALAKQSSWIVPPPGVSSA